jgi:hypothetical protein
MSSSSGTVCTLLHNVSITKKTLYRVQESGESLRRVTFISAPISLSLALNLSIWLCALLLLLLILLIPAVALQLLLPPLSSVSPSYKCSSAVAYQANITVMCRLVLHMNKWLSSAKRMLQYYSSRMQRSSSMVLCRMHTVSLTASYY